MPDGVGSGKGYDLVVDGQYNSFRDRYSCALQGAQYAKQKSPGSIVQIRDCENGNLITVLPVG